jgi:hypothetical protein
MGRKGRKLIKLPTPTFTGISARIPRLFALIGIPSDNIFDKR